MTEMNEWNEPNESNEPLIEPEAQTSMTDNASDASLRRKTVLSLYEWMEAAVFSLLCVTLVFTFFFRIVGVDGDSMFPTLHDKERLIISRLYSTPRSGDIIIINRDGEEPLVKRVIAVAGDTLEINPDTNQVSVNGAVLSEPYAYGVTYPLEFDPTTQVVPDDMVFVMGDNRENSKDSRFMSEVGYIKKTDIMGKAEFRFFPVSRAGGLY